MSVKGQEFPAYDGRGIQGMGLAYATSNRGACHLRGYTVAVRGAGHPGQDRPADRRRQARAGEGLPGRHRGLRLRRRVHLHHLRLGPARPGRPAGPACGEEFTLENVAKIGERIWNMERDFNNRAGFTARTTRCRRAC
jgi:aldehyde:ferredoxin oxidoreductase